MPRVIAKLAKVITKATRKPRRGPWPPDPARETPFQLLCATILSAQTTDQRVNMVTPELFRRYPTAAAMARAPLPALEKIIRSTGFYRQKAKSLKGTATALVERFGGELP